MAITITAVGDIIISRRLSVYDEPRFRDIVDLVRSADVSIANLETIFHDYEDDAFPTPTPSGSFMRADPGLIEDLKWFGFDILSTANNHSLDFMYGGLLRSMRHLKTAGFSFAGTGRNLAAARQPAYLDTANGRVGFISAASTFSAHSRAGAARPDMQGRPGLNPLRFRTFRVVSAGTLTTLKALALDLDAAEGPSTDSELEFLGQRFVVGDETGVRTAADPADLESNLEAVRDAARQADWVIVALHTHESRHGQAHRPAEFQEDFAHACIDSGAHAVVMHGAHVLKGIEIYKTRPIFYGLGNFVYQNMTLEKVPAEFYERYGLDPYRGTPADAFDAREQQHPAFAGSEAWKRWVSVVPKMVFEGGGLKSLSLTPVELGRDRPRSQRGRPVLAGPEEAERILEDLRSLCGPYGTEIDIKDDKGFVAV